jgi:hypothetical protein
MNDPFIKGMCDILVAKKVMNATDAAALKVAFDESEHDAFDEFLLDEGLVDKERILEALAQYYQTPSFDVEGYFFDTVLLRDFPKEFLLINTVIPLETDGDTMLIVVTNDPSKPGLESAIRKYARYDVLFKVGIKRHIEDAIKEYYEKSLTDTIDDSYQ